MNRESKTNFTRGFHAVQAAIAATKTKGSIFEMVYHRLVPHMGHNQAVCAIARRLCRSFGSFCSGRCVTKNEVPQ